LGEEQAYIGRRLALTPSSSINHISLLGICSNRILLVILILDNIAALIKAFSDSCNAFFSLVKFNNLLDII